MPVPRRRDRAPGRATPAWSVAACPGQPRRGPGRRLSLRRLTHHRPDRPDRGSGDRRRRRHLGRAAGPCRRSGPGLAFAVDMASRGQRHHRRDDRHQRRWAARPALRRHASAGARRRGGAGRRLGHLPARRPGQGQHRLRPVPAARRQRGHARGRDPGPSAAGGLAARCGTPPCSACRTPAGRATGRRASGGSTEPGGRRDLLPGGTRPGPAPRRPGPSPRPGPGAPTCVVECAGRDESVLDDLVALAEHASGSDAAAVALDGPSRAAAVGLPGAPHRSGQLPRRAPQARRDAAPRPAGRLRERGAGPWWRPSPRGRR